ncbi:MAG: hypothetical protein RBT59_11695 [Arcobacteraceae bacterium]|jgi:hypothetical protein|nr:hypothetical protein [Arcobacteraceae bacterium]
MSNLINSFLHLFHPDKLKREHIFIKVTDISFSGEYNGWVTAKYQVDCPICKKVETIERAFSFDTVRHLLLIRKIKSYSDSNRLDFIQERPLDNILTEAENFKGDYFSRQNKVIK